MRERAQVYAEPWWLSGGEWCRFCCESYAYHTEYRCSVCDGSVCSNCAVIVNEAVFCPDCRGTQ